MKIKEMVLVAGCFLGGLAVGGLGIALSADEPSSDASEDAVPTERVLAQRNRAGVAKFLADVSRHDALPRGFNAKRMEMEARGMGPLRSRSVLTHHMEDLRVGELEQLILSGELETDEEVALVFKYLSIAEPERAWELCFSHSQSLAQKLLSIRTIAGQWGQTDPKRMLEVIGQSKTKREGVVTRYHAYLGWADESPESLSGHYQEVADAQWEHKRSRRYVATKMLESWMVKDPIAAKEFANSRESDEEREMLQEVIEGLE